MPEPKERILLSVLPLRVRGLERVQLHADLVMLTRLSLALTRSLIQQPHSASSICRKRVIRRSR